MKPLFLQLGHHRKIGGDIYGSLMMHCSSECSLISKSSTHVHFEDHNNVPLKNKNVFINTKVTNYPITLPINILTHISILCVGITKIWKQSNSLVIHLSDTFRRRCAVKIKQTNVRISEYKCIRI